MAIVHRSPEKRQGFAQSAKSAFDSGSHWQRPVEEKGKTVPDWHWLPHSTPLRIKVDAARRETCVCSVCGKEFLQARSDAKTCGSACRQRAYRVRSAEAQR